MKPMKRVAGRQMLNVEGVSGPGGYTLQNGWEECSVPRCGYGQSGQIMQAAAILKEKPKPTDHETEEAMQGNICRCGTYQRIRQGIKLAAGVKS